MNGQGSKALLAAVIFMGVLLVAGSLVLVGVLVHRISHPRPNVAPVGASPAAAVLAAPPSGDYGNLVLDEPAGTHIAGLARQADTLLAISLSGGGPDRIVLWDLPHGRIVGRVRLTP
ncbi:hypothetical protein HLH34_06450 [Gluconacetobacter azotocaptans]|uniref:Uncharacterized protein n=1 Tax=Gluconacetobacter azotocaptans TaxID=142834 RepID=A0A7W4JRM4_9PROT|nr:hypothetical protein [Gluconacetobacter azotocaptans]MBB2189603.1 hypothetical protein [Gluconacetobacter azotocaptans]GBQ36234.1 hypothetical protein AA13594_3246 [Gluconacetobacter azotocaptans DSM 13594]